MSPLRIPTASPLSVALGLTVKKAHKYHAKRREMDGIWFDSEREARRYGELLTRVRIREIDQVELQPRFEIRVNGIFIGTYRADFRFRVIATGARVVEDVKGVRTPVYKLKKKLVEALHGIVITEVL